VCYVRGLSSQRVDPKQTLGIAAITTAARTIRPVAVGVIAVRHREARVRDEITTEDAAGWLAFL
jgi:hypothetical protein